jgi:hypothetical protein
MSYETKYLKYKMKYLALKNQIGGIVGDAAREAITNYANIPLTERMCKLQSDVQQGCNNPCKWDYDKGCHHPDSSDQLARGLTSYLRKQGLHAA